MPEANRALRETPMTMQADLEAYEAAKAADDLLNEWCGEAVARREKGEELVDEDPVLADEATMAIESIRQAGEGADSQELRYVLSALADAHAARLEILRRPGKHAAKKYLRAERQIVELGFGLRRWRNRR